jgi:putative membrane protein
MEHAMTHADRRILLLVGLSLLVLVSLLLGGVGMMGGPGPGMMGWYGYQPMGSWGWIAALGMSMGMLIFWGSLIALAVLLVRSFGREDDRPSETPRAILDRRLAEGEITREKYANMRSVLERDAPVGGGRSHPAGQPSE